MSNKQYIILEEIKKHQKAIARLHSYREMIDRGELDDEILKVCQSCKTKNLHWNVKDNSWTCAFC